jgi:hypothetical protein
MARGISMSDLDVGQAGGIFAGVVAFIAMVGKGLAWLLNWQGARREAKEKRLRSWEASLDRREREYREGIEKDFDELRDEAAILRGDVGRMREQQAAIGFSLLEVTLELRAHVPASPALTRIAAVLRRVYPPEHGIPPEMAELLRALEANPNQSAA